MLVVSSNGDIQTVCYHPHAVLQDNSALCPDCEQTFSKRSKAYKEIANRESGQTRTPTRSPIGVGSSNSSNLRGPGHSNQKRRRRGSTNPTGVDCERTDQTSERTLPGVKASRTEADGDSWNISSEGLSFWERVDLVWPYLSEEERHHVYFTKAVDYPRTLEMLETAEVRRQPPLELSRTQRTVTPQNAEGNELKVGNRVNFQHYWDGEYRQQEATITKLEPHGIKGVVILKFNTENAELLGEVQMLTQQVALQKFESGVLPSEVSTDLKIGDLVTGFYKPSGCEEVGELISLAPVMGLAFILTADRRHCGVALSTVKLVVPASISSPESAEFANLQAERDRLVEDAKFAPDNGWIETGKVRGKDFYQAWWRGKYSGGKKTIYIGRVDSKKHKKAKNAQKARKELKKIVRQIEQLKKGAAHAMS